MRPTPRRAFCVISTLLIAALVLPSSMLAADKRAITDMDLFKFVWIADPQISPDGSRVAFVRVWVNQKADRYENALWIVPAGGGASRQITAGPRDSSPRWSPDGKTLGFVRSPEKDGRPQPPQIFLLSLDGGEARQLTDVPRGAGGFEWSPDGKTIAFSNTDDGKKEQDKPNPENPEPKDKTPERVSDVRVISKAVYRSNGPGYLNPKARTHIWTISVPVTASEQPKAKQITKGNFDEGNLSWSPDGSRIYFVARRVTEPYYESARTDLYSVALDGSDERKLLTFDGVPSACTQPNPEPPASDVTTDTTTAAATMLRPAATNRTRPPPRRRANAVPTTASATSAGSLTCAISSVATTRW